MKIMLNFELNKKVFIKSFRFISFTLTIIAILILTFNYFKNQKTPDSNLVFLILTSTIFILPTIFISFLIIGELINNRKNKPTERFEILKKIGFNEIWNDNSQFFIKTKIYHLYDENLSFICDNKSENFKLITSSNSEITDKIKNEILDKNFKNFRIFENQILEKEFNEININEVKDYINEITRIIKTK